MMKRLLLTFIVGVVVFTAPIMASELVVQSKEGFPPPQLGIAPPRVETVVAVNQGKRLDESIVLYNYSDKAKTISLTLIDIDAKQRPLKPSKSTLSPWAIVNPMTFTIPPNGEQTIRVSIRPPQGFPSKVHYAMLKIDHKIQNPVTINEAEKSVTVSLGSSYGLPFIVTTK